MKMRERYAVYRGRSVVYDDFILQSGEEYVISIEPSWHMWGFLDDGNQKPSIAVVVSDGEHVQRFKKLYLDPIDLMDEWAVTGEAHGYFRGLAIPNVKMPELGV